MKKTNLLAMLAVLVVLGMSGLVMGAEDNDKPKRGRGRGVAGARQRGEGGPGAQRRGQGGPGMMGGHGMMGGPGMGVGFGMFERLGLSEKQRKKIASIREEAMRKMMADIKKILTDEQREQLEKAQAGKPGSRDKRGTGGDDVYSKLDLSKEQSKAIAKIRKKVRSRMQKAETSEERRGMMQQMHEDIKDILTDEQAEKLAQIQKQRQGGKRQRGEGGGNREGRGKGGKGRKGRGQDTGGK